MDPATGFWGAVTDNTGESAWLSRPGGHRIESRDTDIKRPGHTAYNLEVWEQVTF